MKTKNRANKPYTTSGTSEIVRRRRVTVPEDSRIGADGEGRDYLDRLPKLVSSTSSATDHHPHLHRLSRQRRTKSVYSVSVLAGEDGVLPCDLALSDPKDSVQLILWIKEGVHTPIYSYDYREPHADVGPQETKPHHAPNSTLASRITFRSQAPAALVLERLVADDAGVYRCRVDHLRSPTTNTRTNLTVVEPPTTVQIMWTGGGGGGEGAPVAAEDSSVVGPIKEGASLVLTCISMDGWPPPEVVWYEGQEIIDSTHDDVNTFTPHQVSQSSPDSGGDSSGGSDSSNSSKAPSPANRASPHSLTGASSARVTNTLPLATMTRVDLDRRLTCHASNNNLTSPVTASVTIDMILSVVGVEVSGVEAMWAGEEREVECRVYGCRPQPLVVWWLESTMLPTHKYKTIEGGNVTVAVLKMTPRREDDGAMLICQASNTKLPELAYQDSLILTVSYAPVVSVSLGRSLDPTRIKEGDDVYFVCSVDAKPPATAVTWTHNDMELLPGGGVLVSNMSLVVQSVTRARGGHYICQATNTRATTPSPPLTLDVKYAPVCGIQERNKHSIAKRENAEVSCKVDANPPLVTFRWIFNNTAEAIDVPDGRFVVVGTESRVNYTPMNELDYGTLLCWANNSVGVQSHPCVFHILPAGKPDPPHNCHALNVTMTSLKVTCLPGDDGGLAQHFLLQMHKLGSRQPAVEMTESDPTFSVTHLRPATTYLVGVAGVNHRGASLPAQFQVITNTVSRQTQETSAEPTRERDGGSSVPVSMSVGAGVTVGAVLVIAVIILTIVILRRRCRFSRPPTPPPHPSKSLSTLSKDEDTSASPLPYYCCQHHDPDLITHTPDPGGGVVMSCDGSLHIPVVSATAPATTPLHNDHRHLYPHMPHTTTTAGYGQTEPHTSPLHSYLHVPCPHPDISLVPLQPTLHPPDSSIHIANPVIPPPAAPIQFSDYIMNPSSPEPLLGPGDSSLLTNPPSHNPSLPCIQPGPVSTSHQSSTNIDLPSSGHGSLSRKLTRATDQEGIGRTSIRRLDKQDTPAGYRTKMESSV